MTNLQQLLPSVPPTRRSTSPKRVGSVLEIAFIISVGIFATLSVISLRSQVNFKFDMSIQQVQDAGFYVYKLPQEYELKYGLRPHVWLNSFTHHCTKRWDSWNPIHIVYINDSQTQQFEIRISPHDEVWDSHSPKRIISIDATWIPKREVEGYSDQKGISLHFVDKYGMDVAISSNMREAQLITILQYITYVGPDPDTVGNPWKQACEAQSSNSPSTYN